MSNSGNASTGAQKIMGAIEIMIKEAHERQTASINNTISQEIVAMKAEIEQCKVEIKGLKTQLARINEVKPTEAPANIDIDAIIVRLDKILDSAGSVRVDSPKTKQATASACTVIRKDIKPQKNMFTPTNQSKIHHD